jgi:hypothetical protein
MHLEIELIGAADKFDVGGEERTNKIKFDFLSFGAWKTE